MTYTEDRYVPYFDPGFDGVQTQKIPAPVPASDHASLE